MLLINISTVHLHISVYDNDHPKHETCLLEKMYTVVLFDVKFN